MACEEMQLFYAYLDAVEEAKRKAQPWECEVTVIPQNGDTAATSQPAGKFACQVIEPQQARANFGMAGFAMGHQWVSTDKSGVVTLGVPYWFLILFVAMLPAWYAHRRRRKAAKR